MAMSQVTKDSKKRAMSCSNEVEKRQNVKKTYYNFDITNIEGNNRKKESNRL